MIDASVVAEWLLHGRGAEVVSPDGRTERLAAPHLIDAEVAHALRRNVLTDRMASQHAIRALSVFMAVPIARFAHTRLLARAFQLRHNVTIYDALYIALAETLQVRLLTRDAALARVPGLFTTIEVVR